MGLNYPFKSLPCIIQNKEAVSFWGQPLFTSINLCHFSITSTGEINHTNRIQSATRNSQDS
jgi:hypothetical protein